jgi:hypothetical protein
MADQEPNHYTITVVVSRTTPERMVYRDGYDKTGHREERRVSEEARVVLRGATLTDVLTKATNHLVLMKEDSEVPE